MRKVKTNSKLNLSMMAPVIVRSGEQVGDAINRIRKIQGLSQSELAKKAGITQATVSRIEKGTSAEIGTIFLIFSALNIDLQVIPRAQNKRSNSLEGLL